MTASMRRAAEGGAVALALAFCILLTGCAASGSDSTSDSGSSKPAVTSGDVQAGIDAYNRGEFSDAEAALAEVVASDPDNLDALKALALALAAQGKNGEAIERYSQVLELDSKDHVTLYRMALLERLEGDTEDAAGHLQQAVELGWNDSYIDELARTHMQLGEYRSAADAWGTLADDEGRAPEGAAQLLGLQAEALRLAGDIDGAKEALRKALDLTPGNPELQALLEALGDSG